MINAAEGRDRIVVIEGLEIAQYAYACNGLDEARPLCVLRPVNEFRVMRRAR